MSDKVASLGAVRAEKSGKASDWAVIDVLQDAIEKIKSGIIENPEMCVLTIAEKADSDGENHMHYFRSVKNGLLAAGLYARSLHAHEDYCLHGHG